MSFICVNTNAPISVLNLPQRKTLHNPSLFKNMLIGNKPSPRWKRSLTFWTCRTSQPSIMTQQVHVAFCESCFDYCVENWWRETDFCEDSHWCRLRVHFSKFDLIACFSNVHVILWFSHFSKIWTNCHLDFFEWPKYTFFCLGFPYFAPAN